MKPSSVSLFPSVIRSCIFIGNICNLMWYLSVIFLVFHLFPFQESRFCLGIDTITSNQKVSDGETIVSAGGIFELGFFSPIASNNLRYVGIWLKRFPNEKVMWVANRENPVRGSLGALLIGYDGNLVIADGANNTIWSTNVTLASNHTIAVLSDAGNLILKENKSNNSLQLWASFKHPTDCFLPGMKIGINNRTGEQITLTSWKDDTDPSIGSFSLVMDPQDMSQGLIMNDSAKHWRTGQWARTYFIGIPDMAGGDRSGYVLNEDPEEKTVYFSYSSAGGITLSILFINYTGDLLQMDWLERENQWEYSKIALNGPCDLYNTCGPNGSCNNRNSPICKCFKGYEPKFQDEWNSGNWTNGCKRRTELRCERNTSSEKGKADKFYSFSGMKLPDLPYYFFATDISMCKSICLKNCSCLACAYVDGIECMVWLTRLVDVQEFPEGGQTLYIRLADSEFDHGNFTRNVVIIVVAVTLVVGFVTYLLCRRWNTQRGGGRGTIILKEGLTPSRDELFKREISKGGSTDQVPSFTLDTIKTATDTFSATNKLGEGGFGPVYKGKLPNGQEIAVKRLSRSSGQGSEEFKNEVILISRLQHRSLVKLLGFCIQGQETLLVYEYMPNKSLDKLLFGSGSTENEVPDWSLRFKIVEGIARGLIYLHRDSRLKIIHRDLKASNILLDEHMNPKISDFGMARIFRGDQSVANTNRVVGTYGYMSPEYAMQGIFSEKSDVFSFGVLLLEVVSGKRNNTFYLYEKPQTLLGHAWQLWNEGKAIELLDHRLDNSSNPAQVNRCIHVALLCVQQHANDRPTMSVVLSMLCNEMSLTSPDQPAFSSNERLDASNLSMPNNEIDSRNDCSITSVCGR